MPSLIGRLVSMPRVADKIIEIAMRTPDTHIYGEDGSIYMARYWLFNPIADGKRKYPFIPFSVRVHHIRRPDRDRHRHDHPWRAKTWIMRNWYDEEREELVHDPIDSNWMKVGVIYYQRKAGDSAWLGVRRYHRITTVAAGGAWTLFAFGSYVEQWGFNVDGQKVGYKQYELRKTCEAVQHSDQVLCERCRIGWDVNDPCRPNCAERIAKEL